MRSSLLIVHCMARERDAGGGSLGGCDLRARASSIAPGSAKAFAEDEGSISDTASFLHLETSLYRLGELSSDEAVGAGWCVLITYFVSSRIRRGCGHCTYEKRQVHIYLLLQLLTFCSDDDGRQRVWEAVSGQRAEEAPPPVPSAWDWGDLASTPSTPHLDALWIALVPPFALRSPSPSPIPLPALFGSFRVTIARAEGRPPLASFLRRPSSAAASPEVRPAVIVPPRKRLLLLRLEPVLRPLPSRVSVAFSPLPV